MSEILTLAETFKKKSNEQAESIELQLGSVMTKLDDSMTARLSESESIINNGTESLNKQTGQLQQTLEKNNESTNTLIKRHSDQSQALMLEALTESAERNQALIQSYAKATEILIEQKEAQAYKAMKSSRWQISAGAVLFMTLVIGLMIGVVIAKKVIKPEVIYYQQPAKSNLNPYQ